MNLFNALNKELIHYFSTEYPNFNLNNISQPLPQDIINELNLNQEQIDSKISSDLLERYISLARRQFSFQKPKNVFISKELQEKITNDILSKDVCSTIDKIKIELETGIDISSRLSKLIKKFDYDDKMLNDWNIYHFHLSDIDDIKSGFKKRTGELLFVYVPFNSDNVYFLDVSKEHKDKTTFCNLNLLDLINKNWSELLASFTLPDGMKPYPYSIKTNEEYLNLREANINTIIPLNNTDKYILSPGFGQTAAGTSTYNKIQTNKIIKTIQLLIKEKISPENIPVKLILKDNYIFIKNLKENNFLCKISII